MWELVSQEEDEQNRLVYRKFQTKDNFFIEDMNVQFIEKQRNYVEYFKTDPPDVRSFEYAPFNGMVEQTKCVSPVYHFRRVEVDSYESRVLNQYEYGIAFSEEANDKVAGFLNILTDNTNTIDNLKDENNRLEKNLIKERLERQRYQHNVDRLYSMNFWQRLKFLFKCKY